jgi:SAM-dependent methyltransferase
MKLYTDLAEYYFEIEKTTRNILQELRFLHSVCKKFSVKTILDAGCGTGEHTGALNKLGYLAKGLDSSHEMVSIAKKRNPACEFEQGFIQSYSPQKVYDSVFCIFGTFNYLLDDKDILSALRMFYHSLQASGILVLEVWNSYPVIKIQRKPISTVCEVQINNTFVQRNRGFRIKELISSDKPQNDAIVEVNYIYYLGNEEVKDRHVMRVFSFAEIQKFLMQSNFELLEVFGDYGRSPMKEINSRMLLVLRKR